MEYIEQSINVNKYDELHNAICNLQNQKVKEIIVLFTSEEFNEYIKKYGKKKSNIYTLMYGILTINEILDKNAYHVINNLLFKKSIDIMNYECDIDIKISWGKFLMRESLIPICYYKRKSNFTLANLSEINMNESLHSYFIQIKLNLNSKLMIETEYIEIIYDNKVKEMFRYYSDKLEFTWNYCAKIASNMIGTEIKINFKKNKSTQKTMQNFIETIYCTSIKIPEIIIYGLTSECNICLESINNDITPFSLKIGTLFQLI